MRRGILPNTDRLYSFGDSLTNSDAHASVTDPKLGFALIASVERGACIFLPVWCVFSSLVRSFSTFSMACSSDLKSQQASRPLGYLFC